MNPNAAAQTQKLLASLWTRNLPTLKDRLDMIEHAADIAKSASLTPPLRRDAAMTAHKLAGSLGMFGYTEGTELARKLELIFDDPSNPDTHRLVELSTTLRQSLKL